MDELRAKEHSAGKVRVLCIALALGCATAGSIGCATSETPKEGSPVSASPSTPEATRAEPEPEPVAPAPIHDPAVARDLLDKYVELIRTVVMMGGGSEVALELLGDLRQGAESGATSPEFRDRYVRLVDVTSMVFEPAEGERAAAITGSLRAFVRDVEGDSVVFDEGGGLASIGPATVKEVVNLHLLVAPEREREAVRAEVERQLGTSGS